MARRATEKAGGLRQHGVVVSFDAERGYGFIRPRDGSAGQGDVFVHVRNVEGRRSLVPGQMVSYILTRTDKGPAALKVQAGSVLNTPYVRYALVGLGSAVFLLLGMATALGSNKASLGLWLLMWAFSLSIAAFGIYGYDKGQAQGGRTRVPELVLHGLSLLGGSPGAWLAMRLFHHKTNKRPFQIIFWAIVAVQIAALGLWALTSH